MIKGMEARRPMRLRSLLFVPGDRPERMRKALNSGADALILDLEDSVALAGKAAARTEIAAFLKEAADGETLLFVRVNPLDGGLTDADLDAVVQAGPAGIMLPKAEGAASIKGLDERLRQRGDDRALILPIATETPKALFRLSEYADVPERLAGLTWGAEDLPAAVGALTARHADGSYTPPYEMARALTLFAASAAGVLPIETVYPAIRDLEGLAAYAQRGARDGFLGMMAVHPDQVPVINTAFTPSEEEVARAQAVVDAFAANPGAGVLTLDGKMIDRPHLIKAQALLARC
jgi:citrate lyase subunit beta / citryl-CoA lyase